ncbi:MAG: ABC transporter permease [Chloracidobacterium sp.]|nr:ABC transporter permease [Chloracidobacterium sp.]
MNFAETLKLAIDSITSHKLRSFLTLLGMIIGMTAFMIVLSLLQGFNGYVDEKIAGIGSNTFTVMRFSFEDFKDSDTFAAAQRRNKELDFADLDFIKRNARQIGLIGAKAGNTTRDVRFETQTLADVSITGVEPVIAELENVDIAEGRYFSDAENKNSTRVAFVGADVATKLFPQGGAIGREISIQGIPYRIIGVQVAKGSIFGQSQDNFILLPIETFGANFGGLKFSRAPSFIVSPKYGVKMADAVDEVRTLLRIRRKLASDEKDNFGIITPDAISGLRDSLFGTISVVILFVPAIALVVGAIVIMNIMLVAVTERTKEIGIRKAVGAKQSDILRQFLFESALLSAIGGIIGLIIALIAGQVITAFVFPTRIPWWAAVIAIGVSAAVGILAGLFPAWKAAQLDPIEALRAE